MTHRSSRSSRPTTTVPQGGPDPTMPSDVATLQGPLRQLIQDAIEIHVDHTALSFNSRIEAEERKILGMLDGTVLTRLQNGEV
jgi:hypothetical protein